MELEIAAIEAGDDVTIVLAGPPGILREGLHRLLDEVPGFSVVGEAPCGIELFRMLKWLSPNVVLIDPVEGAKLPKQVERRFPATSVVQFSMDMRVLDVISEVRKIGLFKTATKAFKNEMRGNGKCGPTPVEVRDWGPKSCRAAPTTSTGSNRP